MMGDCDAAQARALIRALCDQLHEMTHQLTWIESQLAGPNGDDALRLKANALRRDTAEAQMHIDRLQRRYLRGDKHAQQGPAAGPTRAMRTATRRAV